METAALPAVMSMMTLSPLVESHTPSRRLSRLRKSSEQFLKTQLVPVSSALRSAPSTLSPPRSRTLSSPMYKSSLASPVFTADLKKGEPGTYDFGLLTLPNILAALRYTSVNTANGFWEFTGSGYAVGSGSFKSLSIDAIADTGTTLLLLPDSVVSAYYKQVKGAKNSNSRRRIYFPLQRDAS